MSEKITLFSDFVQQSFNTDLAVKLYNPCKHLISKCNYDNTYHNGLSTYLQHKELSDYRNWENPIFKELENYILEQAIEYKKLANMNSNNELMIPKLKHMWISEMFENGFHEMHQHLGHNDHISGNFYIHCPPGSGELIFGRHYFEYDNWKGNAGGFDYSPENSMQYHFFPEMGQMLLWKSLQRLLPIMFFELFSFYLFYINDQNRFLVNV